MRFVILLILLGTNLMVSAQPNPCKEEVTGVILDIDSKEPLPYATVRIVNSENGTIANEKGEFRLTNICEEEIDLEVRFLGYKTLIHHHDFHHASPVIYMAPNETLLESVVVEESKQGELQSVSIKKKEVNQLSLASSSISKLTDELTGVSLLRTGTNISKPIIHGLHSNRVLVVNNGVRHAYQVWGEEHAPEIDPSNIDQIEVVKGAGTVKYGPEALGGVILYNSKSPEFDKKLNGSIVSAYQLNGQAINSKLSIGEGYQHFAWNVGGYGVYQGDLEAPDYTLSNTGKREFGGSFSTIIHQDKFDLKVSGSYFDQKIGILRGSIVGSPDDFQNAIDNFEPNPTFPSTYDIQNPRQETRHGLIKSDLSLFLGDHIFNISYAYQDNDRKEFDVRRGELNERPVIDLRLQSHNFETEWIQPEKGRWNGNSGIQFFTHKSVNKPESNPVNFVPDYEVFNIGAFTVQSVNFDKTVFELGARFDYQTLSAADTIRDVFTYSNEVDYGNATFTLGFRRQIKDGMTIFSNVGSAWRPPNVAELYSFGYHYSRLQFGLWRYSLEPQISTPADSVFNQSLRPVSAENGVKWVTGIELRKNRTTAEFIVYANRINNYIFLRPYGITTGVTGTFPFFIHDQTNALFLGSDWDVRFSHTDALTSEVKISYIYAKSIEKDQPLLDIPPFDVDYAIELKNGFFTYELNLNYTARQWNAPKVIELGSINSGESTIDRNNDIFDFMSPPDDYFLFGSKVTYQKNHWNASFSVDNLLNSSYRVYTDRLRYFADAPGRNFSFALEYKF